MTDKIKFSIDGKEYLAEPTESIWDVAKKNNIDIPHLCYSPEPGYRADDFWLISSSSSRSSP